MSLEVLEKVCSRCILGFRFSSNTYCLGGSIEKEGVLKRRKYREGVLRRKGYDTDTVKKYLVAE